MKALINKEGYVMETAQKVFDVHPDFRWVDAPADIMVGYLFLNGHFECPFPLPDNQEHLPAPAEIQEAPNANDSVCMNVSGPLTEEPSSGNVPAGQAQRLDIHIYIHQ